MHRSIPYKSKKILWTMDIRFERDSCVSTTTKKYGIKIDKSIFKNIKKFINNKIDFKS
jgi:hypothetical protein